MKMPATKDTRFKSEDRFLQIQKDAKSLLFITNCLYETGFSSLNYPEIAKWFSIDEELEYIEALKAEGVAELQLQHVYALIFSGMMANKVVTFIALRESGMSFTKAFNHARISSVEISFDLNDKKKERCLQALSGLYEVPLRFRKEFKEFIFSK